MERRILVRIFRPKHGCFPLCQRFRKFPLQFKWKGPFRFLLTGIFGITSGGDPQIRSEYSDRNSPFHFWQTGSFPKSGNSVKEFKMKNAISIGWPGFTEKCRSIFLRYFHWCLTAPSISSVPSTPFTSPEAALLLVSTDHWQTRDLGNNCACAFRRGGFCSTCKTLEFLQIIRAGKLISSYLSSLLYRFTNFLRCEILPVKRGRI